MNNNSICKAAAADCWLHYFQAEEVKTDGE